MGDFCLAKIKQLPSQISRSLTEFARYGGLLSSVFRWWTDRGLISPSMVPARRTLVIVYIGDTVRLLNERFCGLAMTTPWDRVPQAVERSVESHGTMTAREKRPWHSMYSYRVSLCPTWLCCRGPFVPVPFSICLALFSLSLIPRFTAFLHQSRALTLTLRRACFYTVLIICFVHHNHYKRSRKLVHPRITDLQTWLCKIKLWNSRLYSVHTI